MNKTKFLNIFIFSLLCLGCSNSLKSNEVDLYVKALGKNSMQDATVSSEYLNEENITDADKFIEVNPNVNKDECFARYLKCETTGGLSELNNYGQYSDQLYPGAVVDIKKPAIANINLVPSNRTLSINLESISSDKTYRPYVVSSPSLSSTRVAVNKLVTNSISKLADYPANISVSATSVSNSDELKIALGVGVTLPKFTIKDEFDYSSLYSSESIILTLKQVYYSIDVDNKINASEYFSNTHSEEEIKSKLENTIPAYVSSVKYGRVAVVRLTSKKANKALQNKLQMAASVNSISGDLKNEISEKIESKELDVQMMAYGGEFNNDFTNSNGIDFVKLINSFTNEKQVKPDVAAALPISYTLRYISDNTLAKTVVESDQNQCYKIYVSRYSPMRIYLNSIEFLSKSDSMKSGLFEKLNETSIDSLSLKIDYSMYNTKAEKIKQEEGTKTSIVLDATRNNKNKKFDKNGKAEFNGVFAELVVDNKLLEKACYDSFEISVDMDTNVDEHFLNILTGSIKDLFNILFNSDGRYKVDKQVIATNAKDSNIFTIEESFYVEAYSDDNASIRFNMSSKYLF